MGSDDDQPPWMKTVTVEQTEIPGIECEHCGHQWRPRVDEPENCPECKGQIDWNDSEIALAESESDDDESNDETTLADLLNNND